MRILAIVKIRGTSSTVRRRNEFHVLHRPDVAVKSEASQFTEMEMLSQVRRGKNGRMKYGCNQTCYRGRVDPQEHLDPTSVSEACLD